MLYNHGHLPILSYYHPLGRFDVVQIRYLEWSKFFYVQLLLIINFAYFVVSELTGTKTVHESVILYLIVYHVLPDIQIYDGEFYLFALKYISMSVSKRCITHNTLHFW